MKRIIISIFVNLLIFGNSLAYSINDGIQLIEILKTRLENSNYTLELNEGGSSENGYYIFYNGRMVGFIDANNRGISTMGGWEGNGEIITQWDKQYVSIEELLENFTRYSDGSDSDGSDPDSSDPDSSDSDGSDSDGSDSDGSDSDGSDSDGSDPDSSDSNQNTKLYSNDNIEQNYDSPLSIQGKKMIEILKTRLENSNYTLELNEGGSSENGYYIFYNGRMVGFIDANNRGISTMGGWEGNGEVITQWDKQYVSIEELLENFTRYNEQDSIPTSTDDNEQDITYEKNNKFEKIDEVLEKFDNSISLKSRLIIYKKLISKLKILKEQKLNPESEELLDYLYEKVINKYLIIYRENS